ncbi:MAG: hypothetical protein ACSLFQ_17395 [Thermoanaerobaculia bacterium]
MFAALLGALVVTALVAAPVRAAEPMQNQLCAAVPWQGCQVGCEDLLAYRADGFQSWIAAATFIDALPSHQQVFASVVRRADHLNQVLVVWRPRVGQPLPAEVSACAAVWETLSVSSVEQGMVYMMDMARDDRAGAFMMTALPTPSDRDTIAVVVCVKPAAPVDR